MLKYSFRMVTIKVCFCGRYAKDTELILREKRDSILFSVDAKKRIVTLFGKIVFNFEFEIVPIKV